MTKKLKIKFLPKNIEVDVNPEKSLLEIARENNITIHSSCNGMCSCGDCRIYLKEGEFHVPSPTYKELKLIGQGHYMDQRRLACQIYCFGSVTVDLSEQEERSKQGAISKQFLERAQKKSVEESHSVNGILIAESEPIKGIKGKNKS